MSQLNTVNVVVVEDGVTTSLRAFPEDQLGNEEAEAAFVKAAQNHGRTFLVARASLDYGYVLINGGTGSICIIHSE